MKVPQELMDKYREINVGHDWWDYTYDYWKNRLSRMGVDVDDISFSGFWSQGDGASFTGRIHTAKYLKRFMRIHGMRERYRTIYTLADHLDMWVSITRGSSHYAHENTVTADADLEEPHWIDSDTEDLREALVLELYNEAMLHWRDFDKDVEETLRGYMHDIYRNLEREYDYLTSDEVVAEAIITNDLFTEQE